MTPTTLFVAMAVAVAALLAVLRRPRPFAEWLLKPLAAGVFLVAGVTQLPSRGAPGWILLVGLGFAALGDVLLIPKDRRAFLGGLVAFLLGHVAYAASFAARGVSAPITAGALALLGLLAVAVLRWLWPHVERPMRVPVLAYVAVISAMVALAIGAAVRGMSLLGVVGAVGFYLSDLSVARDRFVKSAWANRLWGLPLYFFSQLVLALTP